MIAYPTTIPLLNVAGDPPNRQMPATLSGMGQWGWYQRVLQKWRTSKEMMKKASREQTGLRYGPSCRQKSHCRHELDARGSLPKLRKKTIKMSSRGNRRFEHIPMMAALRVLLGYQQESRPINIKGRKMAPTLARLSAVPAVNRHGKKGPPPEQKPQMLIGRLLRNLGCLNDCMSWCSSRWARATCAESSSSIFWPQSTRQSPM